MRCCSSTVAKWGEACTETHRAHSPWEGWRGKRSFQPFLTNEKLGYTPPTVLTVPPRDISHDWAFCLCLSVTEAVQRFSDSVWHHPSQQRPGQSAPRAFPAGSPVDCAGIVSQRWLLQACSFPLHVVTMRCSFIILQAGVCGTVAAEYVFNRGYWQLYSQWYPGSSHLTGNKTASVSDYFQIHL